MNVNSTSSVDNAKVTAVTKGVAGQSVKEGDAGDNGSFLDQLSAFFFGATPHAEGQRVGTGKANANANTKVATSSVSAGQVTPVATPGADPAKSAAAKNTAATSTDAVLKQGKPADSSKANQNQPNSANASKQRAEIPKNLQRFVASDANKANAATSAKTAQAMSDGGALLGRLQQANQALSQHNGKSLPQTVPTSELAASVATEQASSGGKVQADAITDDALAQLQAQQDPALESLSEDELQALQAQLLQVSNSVAEDDVSPELKAAKANKNIHALSDSDMAALMAVQTQAGPVDVATDPNSQPLSPMEAAAMPWAKANADQAHHAPLDDVSDEDGAKAKSAVSAHLASGAQHATSAQQQQAQSSLQQTQHALAAQGQPAAQADAAHPSAHPAQGASHAVPMLHAELAGKAESLTPAMLKAALQTKGLGGIEDVKGSTGSDGHFAHQVAAAAGQQGLNVTQNLRGEQVQQPQSVPMQLSKEMTADEMAERVQVMMSKNLKHVDIRLDPPELGRLHIRLNMHGDGANVQFTVSNQQARDVLEHSMPRLREMLAQQGVQLADTSVQQQNSGQQQRYAAGSGGQSGQSAGNEHFGGEENIDTDVKLDLNVASKRDGISYYA
ncbi:flagellar hook-length control protein FliK [Vibrio furnissii]|uniref:flagellar hook-length control protein FliK n=1 Tax=Vibrio furnissii TaxID=29494 RepID=UPI001EEADA99|nr:flagellar hook-length control protein FliK [Vibrio furnissii]MCG6218580.1 flagellar hook-length control protein FliK [Vibrio furnissii]